MSKTIRMEFDDASMNVLEKQLARLEAMDRDAALNKALRSASTVSAKRLRQILPPPGYPGDKPGLKPLRQTVRVKVKKYDRLTVAMMGYEWNGGQHGHLVEEGHKKVLWGRETSEKVEGKGYLRRAVNDTRDEASRVLDARIRVVVQGIVG